MKKRLIRLFISLLLLLCLASQALAASLYPDFTQGYSDISSAHARAREWFDSLSAPFSFELDRVKSENFLDTWSVHSMDAVDDDGHTHRTIVYTNPENTLEMRLEAILYADVPTVEWVMYAQNTGTENSPILRKWMGLDVVFPCSDTTLMTTTGALNADKDEEDFLPVRYNMIPGGMDDSLSFTPAQARSSHVAWPYFNLRFGEDAGVILAIGWTGQWTAHFDQKTDGLHVESGMGTLNTLLYPGEEIRTPSYSVTFYDGSENDGQNMLRRLFLSHYTPVNDADENKLIAPLSIGSWGGRNEQYMLGIINDFTALNIPVDTVWMDAGWFGDHPVKGNIIGQDEWYEWTGDWFENPNLFPNGLAAIGEAAEEEDLRFLLWLEPERCSKTSAFYQEHKDWCYKGTSGGSAVVNFGNPECLAWWIDYATSLIDETGMDVWRQDFNIDPSVLWRQNDSNNRRGISEIRHIEGLYAFWDALLAHKPGLIIDNCASGGRRLDFEALKRSIPLWSSDYYCGPNTECTAEGAQSHVMALSYWLPIFGTGFGGNSAANPYSFRSFMAPAMQIPGETAYRLDNHVDQAYQARPLLYGDFYLLTPADPYGKVWQAYESFRPDLQQGLVMAFRRVTPDSSATFRLSGLNPDASYAFDDADSSYDTPAVYTGKQLMEEGLTITLGKDKSVLYFFEQVQP